MHSSLLIWHDLRLKQLKDRSQKVQNRRSSKISIRIFETYNNSVQPHGCNVYNNTSDMNMAKIYPYAYKYNGLPHWKYVLCCCDKCPSTVLHIKEENKETTKTFSTIRFHVYRNVSHYTVQSQRPHKK